MPTLQRALSHNDNFDLRASWRLVPLGRLDPTIRRLGDAIEWATHTPDGPATVRMEPGAGEVQVTLLGPGAAWLAPHAEAFTGLADQPPEHLALPSRLRPLLRPHRGVRLVRFPTTTEPLLRVIVQQKVTFAEAARSWRLLCEHQNLPAPGGDLLMSPLPQTLAQLPAFEFTRLGIIRPIAQTLQRVSARHRAIERCAASEPPATLAHKLETIRGVGPWTTGMLLGLYRGHCDSVPLGDFHLPNTVAWALAGEARADDQRMLELLEPYRPQRMRLIRWIAAAGVQAPRRGPRFAPLPRP